MGSREVVQFVRQNFKKKLDAQAIADKVAALAIRRHSNDNVAVVIIDLGGGKHGWGGAKPKQKGLLSGLFS